VRRSGTGVRGDGGRAAFDGPVSFAALDESTRAGAVATMVWDDATRETPIVIFSNATLGPIATLPLPRFVANGETFAGA